MAQVRPAPPVASEAALEEFYSRLEGLNVTAGWRYFAKYIKKAPAPDIVPALWKYRTLKPYLLESGGLIGTEEAERRVLALENPGLPGEVRITRTLTGALQLVLPGETASAHRHSAAALRFIMEGDYAFTTVDGERAVMKPGDLAVTPAWAWHDHRNDSDGPMVWLDGLDVHLVNFMDAMFFEISPEREQPVTRAEGTGYAEAGYNLLPVTRTLDPNRSPIATYPYDRSREALDQLARRTDPDPWHGYKMKYINPVSGGWAMGATIATTIQLLPAGLATRPYRSTDAAVFCVAEGQGESRIGEQTFRWEKHDIFVVPNWTFATHRADGDAVIFSYSDRAAHERLELFREERGG